MATQPHSQSIINVHCTSHELAAVTERKEWVETRERCCVCVLNCYLVTA